MASANDLKEAIGCLSTVFPQFVAKELANLTDQIMAGIQGFTDPLAAIGDISVDSLVEDVATLSEGDVFNNLGSAAAGLAVQHTQREAQDMVTAMGTESGVTKRVHAIRNMSANVISTGLMMVSLFPDMPYAAGQKMCEQIIWLTTLKKKNLTCLRQHIIQLANSIMVLAQNVETYYDETLEDLEDALGKLTEAEIEITNSQRLVSGSVIFDTQAFDRAQQAMADVNRILTPDKDGTSILDVVDILTYGSVESGHASRANQSLVTLVIPSLIHLIEIETSAVVTQVSVINHYINSLTAVIDNYRSAGNVNRVQEMRARAISEIRYKIDELILRIELAIKRGSTRAASGEMLLWSSRVKTILATMTRVKELTLQEGSIEGPNKAYALEQAFQTLLANLASIESTEANTVVGIEDTTILQSQVLALTKGAKRIVQDLEDKRSTESNMANFHMLAYAVATAQVSAIGASSRVATQQQTYCQTFADLDLQVRERYDQLRDSMSQLGLDRAVDMLGVGDFAEFLDSDLDSMSYLGIAISCLTNALKGIDDVQTQQQISNIRDNLIGRKANQEVAAADSSDQGRTRLIDNLKAEIATIQRNAKAVESIKDELTSIGEQLQLNLSEATSGLSAFMGNIDHLAVGAGGRLADGLEEFSDHPNAGVPLCGSV